MGGIPAEEPEGTQKIQVTGMGGTQVTEPERIQATQGVEPEEIPALPVMERMCPALTQAAVLPEELRKQETFLP